jgi:hypothetical protein
MLKTTECDVIVIDLYSGLDEIKRGECWLVRV